MDTTCRLCTKTGEQFTNILRSSKEFILHSFILEITKIQILQDDQLPVVICDNCVLSLENVHKFRMICCESQQVLERLFQSEIEDDQKVADYLPDGGENKAGLEEEISEVEKNKSKKRYYYNKTLTKEQRQEIYRATLRPCDKCGVMVERTRLEQHMNKHLGVKPYGCKELDCGKSFFSSHLLKSHMTHYHSGRSYTCDLCGKIYNLHKSYYNHVQKHKASRYICKFCDRTFKNSTHLKQHIRTHTGERPYKCEYCEKAFASSYNLKTHIRSHTKAKPFECRECGVSYGYNKLLKLHIEKNHPKS